MYGFFSTIFPLRVFGKMCVHSINKSGVMVCDECSERGVFIVEIGTDFKIILAIPVIMDEKPNMKPFRDRPIRNALDVRHNQRFRIAVFEGS